MNKGNLLVVDASFLLHRSLHLELNTTTGEYVGGVYGVLKSLKSILAHAGASKAIFVWDGGKSKRRMQIYPGYKASRAIVVDEEAKRRRERYRSQRDILEGMLPMMGVRSNWIYGKEADDIIGWMVEKYKKEYPKILVVSEDWDYAQLIDKNVTIHFPIKGLDLSLDNFLERTGYRFEWHNVYRGVLGDGSDEIDGVPGVGEVTLKKWVDKADALGYPPSIASLMEVCREDKSKRAQTFLDSYDIVSRNIELMYMLAEEFTAEEQKQIQLWIDTPCYFTEDAAQVMANLEFKSLLQSFSTWSVPFRNLI